MRAHYWETRQSMTPEKALQYLKEGNDRFLNNLSVNRNSLQLINDTADKQFPFAAVLSCSDSRVPVELVFDQGLGDIFSVRLAGNVASINAIGSIEYSCKVLGSKLVMVMGHTGCGAVQGACDDFKMENLTELLGHIRPAVEAETTTREGRDSSNKEFVNNVSRLNVEQQINQILSNSVLIREMLAAREIALIGGLYDVETGKVIFFEEIFNTTIGNEKFEIYSG